MSQMQGELAERFAELQGARATWLVPARHTVDVLAKIGLVGPEDHLVAFADDFSDAFAELFPGRRVTLVAEPSPDAFLVASGWGADPSDAEEPEEAVDGSDGPKELGWGDTRLAVTGSPASYAYPAGRVSHRTFWFVSSIGGLGLRVPDLRELSRAAAAAGALLIVDNTVPSAFGCHPLKLGATISLEALDRVAAGALSQKVVAVSVARSLSGRGRRRVVRPEAEDAYRLLIFDLGDPAAPAHALELAECDLAALAVGLDTLASRMQHHTDNARAIAEYLRCHPKVGHVFYPGLKTHADHACATGVLEHGFGPAIDFSLTGSADETQRVRHERFLALCEVAHRNAPAGGAVTRIGIAQHRDVSYLRMFAGTDDLLYVADSLDQALRLFCNPPEP